MKIAIRKVLVLGIVMLSMWAIYSLSSGVGHNQHLPSPVKAAAVDKKVDDRNTNPGVPADNSHKHSVEGVAVDNNVDDGNTNPGVPAGNSLMHKNLMTHSLGQSSHIIKNTRPPTRLLVNEQSKDRHEKPRQFLHSDNVQGKRNLPFSVERTRDFQYVYLPQQKHNRLLKPDVDIYVNRPEKLSDHSPRTKKTVGQNHSNGGHPETYAHPVNPTQGLGHVEDQVSLVTKHSMGGAEAVTRAGSDVIPKRRTIIYSCNASACGGWADRQKGVVSAFILSVLMDRDFKLYMPRPCDVATFLAPNKVNWTLNVKETEGQSVHHVLGINVGQTYDLVKRMLAREDLNIAETDADYVFITWNMEVVHMLRTHPQGTKMSTGEIYRHVLQQLFRWKLPAEALQGNFQGIRSPANTKLACAQIRTGDDSDLRGWDIFNTLDSLHVLFDFLRQFNDSDRYRIFFTSDKTKVLAMAREKFPAVFMSSPGPITHVDTDRGKDACAGLGRAIWDQLVLAACDVLIISRSGFGKIAAFLRNTDYGLYLFHGFKITSYRRSDNFGDRLW